MSPRSRQSSPASPTAVPEHEAAPPPGGGPGYALMTASTDGRLRWTARLDDHLVAPAPEEGRPSPVEVGAARR